MNDTAKAIHTALEILSRQGWCKGLQVDADGRHCILGALHAAAPELQLHIDAVMVVRALVYDLYGYEKVADFNDAPSTTWNMVQELLSTAHLAAAIGAPLVIA